MQSRRVKPGKVFPHNLRHLFAVSYYALDKDVVRLADLLGHSSIDTTRIYIASGDFLTRNTECRVEVGVRVEDPVLIQKLSDILQLQLRDNVNAREMRADGSYQKVKAAPGEPLSTARWTCTICSGMTGSPGIPLLRQNRSSLK